MNNQEFIFTGYINQINEDRKNTPQHYRPFRFEMRDENNQTQWFGTFDQQTGQMIEKGGVNSGLWTCEYIIKPWKGDDGVERFNYNVKTITGSVQPQQQEVQQTPQVPTQAPVLQVAPPNSEDPLCSHGNTKLQRCQFCIVRQCGFKEIHNIDDKTPEQIIYLTDLYESILLKHYIPEPTTPDNDPFLQHEV